MGSGLVLRSLSLRALLAAGLALAAAAPAQAAPMHADRDGDGVYDDLESRLQDASPDGQLRVIVRLSADATRTRAERLEDSVASLDVRRRFGVVDAVAAVVEARDVRELASEPAVAAVEPDTRVHAANASAQSSFGVTEARLDMPSLDGDRDGAPGTYSPADMVAAVIDTGIDTGHADLDGGKVLAFQDFTDGNYTDVDAPIDPNGHGTHVSGTIAGDGDGGANGRGVAPGAGLVGLRVLDASGNGWSSDILAAIDWIWKDPDGAGPAASNGATYGIEAINLSLGGTGCSNGNDSESQAVNHAAAAGYVVAVAAGNDGPAGCTSTSGISSPAAAADAITVGAMADVGAGGFYLAKFSSRGPTLDGRIKPDIAAPGVNVTSAKAGTTTGYATYSGTSMATPFVAGVALLMRDLNPLLTSAQVKQKIMQTAVDWGSPGTDPDHGAGRLDAYAALAAATDPAPPALTSPPTSIPSFQHVSSTLGASGASRTFTITPQAGYPLAIGLTAPSGADFDMYLRNSSGNQVAMAETPYRQDELHVASPASGPYTLEVRSYSGAGTFYLDLSGATTAEAALAGPPVNQRTPAINGTVAVGQPVTADPGTWDGAPSFTYTWQACTAAGQSCDTLATTQGYTIGSAAEGRSIRVSVTATNPMGSTTINSPLVAVPYRAPIVRQAPALEPVAAREGNTLVAQASDWQDTDGIAPNTNLARAWERCDAEGANCAPIAGATDLRYLLTPDDIGSRLRYVETATNAGGSTRATSPLTTVVADRLRPPSLASAPTVTGTVRHGDTLSLSDGSWTGLGPDALTYQWLRCDAGAPPRCEAIEGATQSTYGLTASDIGSLIVGRVTASSEGGTAVADSEPTAPVAAAVPVNRLRPVVRGNAARGRAVRAHGGTWWGSPTVTFSVRWLRCDRNGQACHRIAQATGSAYVPGEADVGHTLRARITAANEAGRRSATSAATAVVRRLPARPPAPRELRKLTLRVATEADAAARRVRVRLA